MRIVDPGLPLPVGAIENRRSMVFVANLADFIRTCMCAPAAANATFLVSDGVDLSTPAIVRRIAHGLGKPARLLAILRQSCEPSGQWPESRRRCSASWLRFR
ncbi:hypothetical protein BH11GEM2_BH11GEM2_07230 [soil metagenome]